jgi:hypothetical protein
MPAGSLKPQHMPMWEQSIYLLLATPWCTPAILDSSLRVDLNTGRVKRIWNGRGSHLFVKVSHWWRRESTFLESSTEHHLPIGVECRCEVQDGAGSSITLADHTGCLNNVCGCAHSVWSMHQGWEDIGTLLLANYSLSQRERLLG